MTLWHSMIDTWNHVVRIEFQSYLYCKNDNFSNFLRLLVYNYTTHKWYCQRQRVTSNLRLNCSKHRTDYFTLIMYNLSMLSLLGIFCFSLKSIINSNVRRLRFMPRKIGLIHRTVDDYWNSRNVRASISQLICLFKVRNTYWNWWNSSKKFFA